MQLTGSSPAAPIYAHTFLNKAYNELVPIAQSTTLDHAATLDASRAAAKIAIHAMQSLDVPLALENAQSGVNYLGRAASAITVGQFQNDVLMAMSMFDVAAEGVANAYDLFD